MSIGRRNRRTALMACLIILGMAGLTAASVPLYDLFCAATGYGGTPRINAQAAPGGDGTRITVQFNGDIGAGLPWRFRPMQRSLTLPVGEERLAFYEAVNDSDGPVVGRAVYNVTPFKVGPYFDKVHCFCFEEQTLQAGERVEMPVSFYVDPALVTDPGTSDVRQITLSYTFFIDEEATAKLRAAGSHGSTS